MSSPFELEPRRSALVLIDLQYGIVALPLAPYARQQIIDNAVRLAQHFSAAGATVIPVRVGWAADGADRLAQPVDEPSPAPPGGLPAQWSELVPEIAALKADVQILKHQWSAFHGTELDLQLRRRGIVNVVIAGISTNLGVDSTARDAWQHGYAAVVAEDACSSTDSAMHQMAMHRILPRVSRVRSTGQIIAALK
jgi:nicotinamidase-related amidase